MLKVIVCKDKLHINSTLLRDGISMVPKLPFRGFPRLTYKLLMGNIEETIREILGGIVGGNTGGSAENTDKKLLEAEAGVGIEGG